MNKATTGSDKARASAGLHDHVLSVISGLRLGLQHPILDIGCGNGVMLGRLAELGHVSLTGVDIKPPADDGRIRYLACDLDAPRISVPDESVDLVILVEVIEHMENIGLLLAEIRRILSPTGLLLITTPNVHSIEARLRFFLGGRLKQFDAIGDPTHIAPIFRYPFLKVLERHGLEVRRSWGFPESGGSPTSRPSLRFAGAALRGLGMRAEVDGDQWCLLVGRRTDASPAEGKQDLLTRHY